MKTMVHHFPRSGATLAVINYPDGTASAGLAFCHISDQFSRATGRRLAITRAQTAGIQNPDPMSALIEPDVVRAMLQAARRYELAPVFQRGRPVAFEDAYAVRAILSAIVGMRVTL